MRDDDGLGPVTLAAASGAAICQRISGAGHKGTMVDESSA